MKNALVEPSGRIAEVRDDIFPVHPSLTWVAVPDDTTTRDTLENGVVIKEKPAPPPPLLTDIVDQIIALSPVRKAALKAELAKA